jgi:hypothetical protein
MPKSIFLLFAVLILTKIGRAQGLDFSPVIGRVSNTPNQPCGPCTDFSNKVEYNYLKNEISGVKMKVGKPFVFNVINVNHFRDEVQIRDTSFSFNTDPSALDNILQIAAGGAAMKVAPVIDKDAIYSELKQLSSQLTSLEKGLASASDCVDVCMVKREVKNEVEKYFTSKFSIQPNDLLSTLLVAVDQLPDTEKSNGKKIVLQYVNFVSAQNYVSYYIPKVKNVDRYVFTLSIIPKAGASSNRMVRNQEIEVNTVGGIKFDLSPGFFVTNLSDAKINLRPDSSVIRNSYGGDSIVYNRRNQINQEDTKGFSDLGFAGFLHIYPRLSDLINVGFSLGVGTTISNKPKPRYLAGINLIVGVKQRFSIGAGFAAGNVEVLQQGYASGDFISSSKPESITTTTFKIKHYLAVSYNIPLGKVSEK